MGREKRISEIRAKDSTEIKTKSAPNGPERPAAAATATTATAAVPQARTSTGKAIAQILGLYVVPVIVIYVLGKLVFNL